MASSLLLPYLSPKTLILSKTKTPSTSLSSASLSLTSPIKNKNPLLFSSSLLPKKPTNFSSVFVQNVSVSSELEQEEEVSNEREPNFSPDLKLFVGNLPFTVDSATLAGLFERAGNVEMVEVIYDKFTGRSRGFGFVTMSTVEEVEAAAQQFNGYELDGRPLRVNFGPPPPKDDLSPRGFRGGGGGGGGGSFDAANRLYVGNLSWGVDDSALETLFSECGKVMEARVVYDRESGRSRGFGFVTYSSAEEVSSAISSLNGVDLDGRAIRVSVAEARPRRQF
ncbi:29 kDa ribonucleoprotein A, chloroplastic-like [Tasmannia lanceolata]|uniref:29 kDa ribonucleoprotein A, chloroplastic-like n=1 Tax=Tasmannia lanceolata TaxID=3420 RepID=UPI0040641CD2